MFRNKEDKKIIALVGGLSVLDLGAYLLLNTWWVLLAYWLVLFVPKGLIAPWNHHHQHCMTFKSTLLNRLLEISYGLHTGMTGNLWVLHHNLGHHVNYMDQAKDESRWRRKSGKRMGVVEYSLNVAVTSYYRAFQVGKRYPKHQRVFVTMAVLTFGLVAILTYLRPLPGLFVFVLPMISTLIYTSWVTYDHHAGLDGQDHYHASFNIMNRWFNRLTGNLGYHTAHHYKPGLHWSKLPALHAKIADQIDDEFFVKSTFDVLLPDDNPAVVVEGKPVVVVEDKPAVVIEVPVEVVGACTCGCEGTDWQDGEPNGLRPVLDPLAPSRTDRVCANKSLAADNASSGL